MEVIKENKISIEEIVTALKDGAVLVLPTDTVYGLVCDAKNEKAVEKIFDIKKRDKLKPLGIFVKDIEAVNKFAITSENQIIFLRDNKITSILKVNKEILSKLVYNNSTIGIRIPRHNLLNKILDNFDGALAQTSANMSGASATIKIKDILEQFKEEDIIVIDGGDLPENFPSKVIDLTKNIINILRP